MTARRVLPPRRKGNRNTVQVAESQDMYATKPAAYFGTPRTDIAPLLPGGPGQSLGRVLEIGCGSGATMAWLRTQRDVTLAVGVELTQTHAELARAAFDQVIVGNVEDPAIAEALPTFDLILALDVLEHLVDPAAAVGRLAARLAPGGAFVASLPNVGYHTVALPLLLKGRWTYADAGLLDRTHLRFFDITGARALLTTGDLAVERLDEELHLPFLRWPPFNRSARLRWYGTRMAGFLIPRHLYTYHFLIRARRAPARS
jgi:SAM-dependent methyltransferase